MKFDDLPNELKQLVEQGGSSPMGLALTAYQYGCGDLFERAALEFAKLRISHGIGNPFEGAARDAAALVAAIKRERDGAK